MSRSGGQRLGFAAQAVYIWRFGLGKGWGYRRYGRVHHQCIAAHCLNIDNPRFQSPHNGGSWRDQTRTYAFNHHHTHIACCGVGNGPQAPNQKPFPYPCGFLVSTIRPHIGADEALHHVWTGGFEALEATGANVRCP